MVSFQFYYHYYFVFLYAMASTTVSIGKVHAISSIHFLLGERRLKDTEFFLMQVQIEWVEWLIIIVALIFATELVPNAVSSAQDDLLRDSLLSVEEGKQMKFMLIIDGKYRFVPLLLWWMFFVPANLHWDYQMMRDYQCLDHCLGCFSVRMEQNQMKISDLSRFRWHLHDPI